MTGAASGIGLAVCHRFARVGAHIGMIDMDTRALEIARNELEVYGTKVMAVVCDITDRKACEGVIGAMIKFFGGIDVLFNNAGITQRGAFADTRVSVFEQVMAVNFFGSLYCTRAAIHSLIQRKGVIIANESIAGVAPVLGRTGYSASKHAMNGLFSSLRAEVRDKGVHVMIVCPGFIRTNLQDRALGCDGNVTSHPQSRIGRQDTPENAADRIYKGAVKEKDLLVLTLVGKLGYLIYRLMPGLYERIMTGKLKSELNY